MAWLALILGIAALWVAIRTRAEQARQRDQISRLKSQLFKERWQPPGQVGPRPLHDRPTPDRHDTDDAVKPTHTPPAQHPADAPIADEEEVPAPPWAKQASVDKPERGPKPPTPPEAIEQPDKNKTLHRLASSHLTEPVATNAGPAGAKTKAKAISFEERLGAGVYVWAGGIALMLAGAFLVKYSFDNDLLSVRTRLVLVGSFGAVLVLSSLWLRSRADKIAASICGAGVADLFVTVLAATAYYDVVDPWTGFALMALVTATAVGMSLVHGPYVALLGLIGGFVTPTLINGVESAWGPTFTYLLLLEIGLAVVTRKRQWFGLSALTLLAAVLSALAYAAFSWSADSRGWLILFVLGTAVVFVLNAARGGQEKTDSLSPLRRIWLGIGAVGSSALLLSMLVALSRFSMQELSALGLLGAGAVLLARLDRRYVTLAFLAQGLCGMMLLAWPLAHEFAKAEFEPTRYFQVAIGYGLVFAFGGFLCLWRNARPAVFAWLSSSGALTFVVLAHLGGERHLPQRLHWWMVYAVIAGVVTVAAALMWRSRTRHATVIIDPYALSAAALATLAVWFGLDHPWVAVAWAGLAVIVTALDRGLRLPRLIVAAGWLTAGCVGLLIVPGATGYDMPMRLIANTMLAHYGVPALCFAAIAWMVHRHAWPKVRYVYQALALVTATAAVSLQVRIGFHPDDLWADLAAMIEWASFVVLWLGVCWMVLRWFISASLDGLQKAATTIGVVGLVAAVLYLLFLVNPLFTPTDLGGMRVLNWLLYAYGAPCVLALMVARVLPEEAGIFKQAAAGVSFVLLFALVTLEVRHGFAGSEMFWRNSPRVGLNEWATYSVALVVLSLVMSWVGWRWRTQNLVLPAAVMGLAGLAAAVLGPVLIDNPLLNMADVGAWRGLNWLVYIYGLPCLGAAALAYTAPAKMFSMKQIAVTVSLLMLFALVSLEIRQGFVGPDLMLSTHPISSAENYSYSLAWVLLALTLLVGGLVTGSPAFRYGSLAVMLVAIGKVALDTAQLRDLWRVLSLLGLGLSLIVLGYVYQRFVFRRPPQREADQE